MSTISRGKQCLFGGALVAAGLSASTQADFIIGETTHNAGLSAGAYVAGYAGAGNYTLALDFSAPFGPSTASVSFPTGTAADVVLSDTVITGTVEKKISSFGYFAFVTTFTVTEDMDVMVSWDVSDDVPTVDRRFRVYQSMGPDLFEYDPFAGPHAGTATISLVAGQQYFMDTLYRSIGTRGPGTFSLSQIPESDCPADCAPDNGDGTFGNDTVNIDDLLAVINNFGNPGGPCDNAPDNGDGTFGNGIVNIDDLLGVINAFGACP
ncbi:MAG: hypothetical protein AAF432_01410 [Planctomycetota bacterium]